MIQAQPPHPLIKIVSHEIATRCAANLSADTGGELDIETIGRKSEFISIVPTLADKGPGSSARRAFNPITTNSTHGWFDPIDS